MSVFRELAPRPEDAAAEALAAEAARQARALAGQYRDGCLGYVESIPDPWKWIGEAAPLLEILGDLL